ncbi:MAG: phosphoribosyltransferase family protein [Acidimicrobiales bacterium]
MLLPSACSACGVQGPALCERCWSALRLAPPSEPPAELDSVAALLVYADAGRELVARLKYRNARSAVGWLADGMAALVDPEGVDAVTWVPTTPSRRRQRGFDQGRLLATAVARRLHRPCPLLLSRREGPPQTGRSRVQRLVGPELFVRRWRRSPSRVLLVDDVLTTGATLGGAARVLRVAGAHQVHAVTAAMRR